MKRVLTKLTKKVGDLLSSEEDGSSGLFISLDDLETDVILVGDTVRVIVEREVQLPKLPEGCEWVDGGSAIRVYYSDSAFCDYASNDNFPPKWVEQAFRDAGLK